MRVVIKITTFVGTAALTGAALLVIACWWWMREISTANKAAHHYE